MAFLVVIVDTTEGRKATLPRRDKRTVERKTGLGSIGRTKEELFSGSDRWHQEKVEDFCGRLHS